jgi:nucleoside-diphosphate-sugar epimerase
MVTPRTVLVTGATGYIGGRLVLRLVPVPVLTPRLSSYWVHLVTPVPAVIARPLIQELRNDVIVRDEIARRLFPRIKPLDHATAVRLALTNLETGRVETEWSDARASSQGDVAPVLLWPRRKASSWSAVSRSCALLQRLCMPPSPGWGPRPGGSA